MSVTSPELLLPSNVVWDNSLDAGQVFPTRIPNVEQLVYDHVYACTRPGVDVGDDVALRLPVELTSPADLEVFAGVQPDGSPERPFMPVVRGWPVYPGKVPQIGVAAGADTTDQATDHESGGFAGDVVAVDRTGRPVASASYYSHPIFTEVVVELIHENRDERDRLHAMLRRVLFPLRRRLPVMSELVRNVTVSAERQELPLDEQPIVIYVSVFTVQVWSEMLEATDVTGPSGIIHEVPLVTTP